MTTAPTLATGRLTLRMPVLADVEHRAACCASDRSVWEGGPMDRAAAWRIGAPEVGQWPLLGYGSFSVDDHDGTYVGEVGTRRPAHYPKPELGWCVVPQAEGRRLAAEAVRVMEWARDALGLDHLASCVTRDDARWMSLVRRLGGEVADRPGSEPGDVVDLHSLTRRPDAPTDGEATLVYRHPAPEAA